MAGNILRLPLRLIPRGLAMPVVSGPLRGYRWIVGSGVHGVWIGSYERTKLLRVQAALSPGDVFFDIGAHAGIYSLAAARVLGEGGAIVAVEPNSANAARFVRHMSLNGIDSVRLIQAAASDVAGRATFSEGPNDYEGRLDPEGEVAVETVRLDDIQPAPSVIKIDVEGHEAAVLRGARRILDVDRPVVFVAVHGAAQHSECVQILEKCGYDIEWLDLDELVARPR